MWQIDNRTPFAVGRSWVRDRNGAEVRLVAVKCTFDIGNDGSTRIAAEQPVVAQVPEYFGEPGRSSIRYDADLILAKATTDVVVIGHAWAPGGRPVTQLDVGLRVGPIQKVLRVYGDRTWGRAGISSPQPFVKMPIVYERAFGGVDTRSGNPDRDFDWRNPIGTGFAVTRDNLTGVRLPNIEYPDEPVNSWGARPRPAGFGAIASHWQPRAGYAGTYDEKWMQERQPLLPHDFDTRFFQCAPADQQTPQFLRGGEPINLFRLTPEGELRLTLPFVALRMESRFYTGGPEQHPRPLLHSVILEPGIRRISLVWHSALQCHFRVHKLERTIVKMKEVVRLGESVESREEETMEPAS